MKKYSFKRVSFAYPFLVLIIFSHFSFAQSNFLPTSSELRAYNHVWRLDLQRATAALSNSKDPSSLYFAHFTEFVDLMVNEDVEQFDAYEDNFEDRLQAISKIKDKSPYRKFYLSQMHLHWSFVYMKMGHEFSSAWQLKKAFKISQQNADENPDFMPQQYNLGILQVMLGAVPEKYHWLLGLFGMKESFEEGVLRLDLAARTQHVFQYEASCVRNLVDGFMLNKREGAIQSTEKLLFRNKDFALVEFLYLSLLLKNNAAKEAHQYMQGVQSFKAPIFYYIAGEFHMQRLNFKKAILSYNAFLNSYKGLNNIKDAYYKIGLAYKLMGYDANFGKYHEKAKVSGLSRTESDKYADKQLKVAFDQNLVLLRARFLTDGGYYQLALEELKGVQLKNIVGLKNQTEYFYRKARIFHKLKNSLEAERFYRKTITHQGGNPWYFAPNACLQLGYLHVAQKDFRTAKIYFTKALAYKKHEYKNSIDNKAKSAINLLPD